MSFIDLATLALHRRHEMEARIKIFIEKCDLASTNLEKLKTQAQNFVQQLNCEPSELKERFLNCMMQLDEFIYLVTDFNLSAGKIGETGSMEYTPVLDTSKKTIPPPLLPTFNIIDVLSEPMPSTSTACPNFCPLDKPKRKKVPKEEQALIVFSSASCSSAESVPKIDRNKKEKEVQCELVDGINKIALRDAATSCPEACNLPAQTILQTDQVYSAVIMHIDGGSFWVITECMEEVFSLTTEMTEYYKQNHVEMSLADVKSLVYCAYYDNDSDCYYRALRLSEEVSDSTEVYLVDTGETHTTESARKDLQPLAMQFCTKPPYARVCHFAGLEFTYENDKDLLAKHEKFMKQYLATDCFIEVDDNTSESLGVYVRLKNNEILNGILVQQGLAISTDSAVVEKITSTPKVGPPEMIPDSELDITDCPEYEDPVEAVTGYSCRDEADICKHYKGGKEKTCFKGTRCKKKHIMKHPDGWTLDRVEVAGNCRPLPLPAPGTWHKVYVTFVCHFDRMFVQFVEEKKKIDEIPSFGVMLPPSSLEALVRDMNSPATRTSYKPLTMTPATGELVAALYPPDNQWYRARVLTVTRSDQNVEVRYIDYGNSMWVKEDAIRVLEPRYTLLPEQAVQCAIAGVHARSHDSRQWVEIKKQLVHMAEGKNLDAHVIARDYDELTVELFDEEGYNIAEQLAALNLIVLTEYEVSDDSKIKHKLCAP